MLFDVGPDKRFYGIYRALVANNADPDGLGRLKLKVPQVLGDAITTWAWPITGSISQSKVPYITVVRNSDLAVTAANTATVIPFDIVEDFNGMRVDSAYPTRVVAEESGDYFVQFSAVFDKSSSNSDYVDIWIRKNGVDIPRSNSRTYLSGNPTDTVLTVGFIVDLDKDDYFELVFLSPDHTMLLSSHTGLVNRPDVPAIIATANLVGKFKPQPDTNVWAMFEGGDPNFPVWIGAY